MNLRRNKPSKPSEVIDVVTDLKNRTQQAQALASVPRQELLSDPRLNPDTRGLANELESARLRERLDLEHRRVLRSEREADRQAAEAVRAAEAVDQARAATDPAYTVLTLVRNRGRFAALALGASLVLSVGSAMGLETAVSTHFPGAPTGIGYLAEVALTGMSTAAIIWAGLLARGDTFPVGGWRTALIALITVPLLVSIVGSSIGSGPVGAVASIGSAAFAWFSYLVSVTSSVAITQLVNRMQTSVTVTEASTARTDTPGESAPAHTGAEDGLDVVGEAIVQGAEEHLRSHGGPSERSHEAGRSHGEIEPAPAEDESQVNPSERPSERDRSHGDDETTERVLTAQERRRLEGEQNRRAVARILYQRPDALTGEIARELGLGESTVRRIRKELENGGASS